jgi:hypothetical protein
MLATALLLALNIDVNAQGSQKFSANGTFTVPAGVTNITVECWGGGGAGGQVSKFSDGKGGGGGGAYASNTLTVISGSTHTVTVGKGGIVDLNLASTSGGSSSFDALVKALGGANGDNNDDSGTGGLGGSATGSTGTTKYSGGNGGDGNPDKKGAGGGGGSSASASSIGMNGADATNKNGGAGGILTGGGAGGDGGKQGKIGKNGTAPGGGGGGSGDQKKKSELSGDGGDGQVFISWSCTAPTPLIEFTLGGHDHTCIINTTCGEVGGGGQNDLDIDSGDPGGSATYQWQVSYDDEATWVNAPGPTGDNTQYVLDPLYTTYESVADIYYFRIVITKNLCFGISNSIKLTVTLASDLLPGSVAGDKNYCLNGDALAFTETAQPTGGGGVGTYSYKWQSSFDNISFVDIWGTNNPVYNPPSKSQTIYYRRIVYSGSCLAISNIITIKIFAAKPATPGTITGPTPVCTGDADLTYSVDAVPNATSYTWTVPADWTISAGQGTTAITTIAGNISGAITVTANNICGTSAASIVAVNVNPLPTIIGNLSVCVGSTTSLSGSGTKALINPWTSDNLAFATVDNSGLVTGVAEGTSIITYTNDNGCSINSTATVSPKPSLKITDPASVCSPASVDITNANITVGSSAGLTFTYWMDELASLSYATPTTTLIGTYYIKGTDPVTGCYDIQPVNVIVNPTPTITITNPAAVCSPATVDITTADITSGSTAGLTYTYWTEVAATSAYITKTLATDGTYYIKGTTLEGCYDIKAVAVTVTPPVGTPVFLPSTSTRYQAIESVSYTATSASVITYSLDLISTAAGNSIEPTTGLVNYSGTWSGTSIITASVTGCNGSRTATHSVRTNWCFALYAGAGAIHNDLLSTVTGDIGSNTGLIDGFGGGLAGTVNGTIHNNDATTLQAVTDLDDLFAVLDTKPINHVITTLDNTQIVEPGVYFLGAAAPLSGELILDGGGNPDAVFIIKIGGALSTQALSKVTLQNGTSVNNVYWIIKGAANIGENSVFRGTFIGTGEINLLTGSKLFGRALTKVGAITLTNCEVSSICAPYTCMSDNEPPTFTTPTLNPGYCVEDIYQAIYKDDAQGTSTDLTFVRPDYYTLLIADFNILDLISPADNCTLLTNPISWTINFADGRDNITSTGLFSTYVPIIPPLNKIEFPLGTNHITYTVTDLAGNTTVKSINLVVTPRPGFN